MGLRFCNIYGHRITGIPEGSTTDLNNNGDFNSNTMPRSIAMVIKPFKDTSNVITGESGGGSYVIEAANLKISGLSGLSMSPWINYGTDDDGSWDYTASPDPGCPLNNTEFAPLSQAVTYPTGDTNVLQATPNPGIGHDFWRTNLGTEGNWDLGDNQIEGEPFNSTLSSVGGYEPHAGGGIQSNYRYWSKSIMDVYCAAPDFYINNGTIGENFCDRWPPHVQNIVAVNSRLLTQGGITQDHRDNVVFVVITFVEGFDWDEVMTIGGSGPASEILTSENDFNNLMFSIDIEGEATWRPGT